MDREKIGIAVITAGLGLSTGCAVLGFKDGWKRRLVIGVVVGVLVAILGCMFAFCGNDRAVKVDQDRIGSSQPKASLHEPPAIADKKDAHGQSDGATESKDSYAPSGTPRDARSVEKPARTFVRADPDRPSSARPISVRAPVGGRKPTGQVNVTNNAPVYGQQIGNNNRQELTFIAPAHKPWSLTAAQVSALAKVISSKMVPHADCAKNGLVGVMVWDSDSTRLAFGLVDAFRSAGWDIPAEGFWSPDFYHRHDPGLYLLVPSRSEMPRGAVDLVNVIKEFGINLIVSTESRIPKGEFRILVASRPDE